MKKFKTLKHQVKENTKSDKLWKAINTFLLSVLIIIIGVLFFYPIDVLKDESWNITVQGQTHNPGTTINVSSTYQKVRNVEGVALRYLDCQNSEGAFVRYPVNQVEANRVKGVGGTGILLPIPNDIPTPTKCKVAIQVKYNIFKFGNWVLRSVSEYRESKTFDLVGAGQAPSPLPPSETSTQPRIPNSKSNPTPQQAPNPIPQATPQAELEPTEPTPQEEARPIEALPTICLPLTNICIN